MNSHNTNTDDAPNSFANPQDANGQNIQPEAAENAATKNYPDGACRGEVSRKRISRADFLRGARIALPVMLGYFPVGFAFGVLAVQGGLNPFTTGLMSYLVYAGSAQLIAANLLMAGDSSLSIIITTFVVNLRHLLMSAAVTPHLREWSKSRQAWFSFEMTDETFALHLSRFCTSDVNPGEVFGINTFSHWAWVLSGVSGALFGDVIGDVKPYGLDYALIGMFIALLLPHVRIPRRLLAVICGALLSVGLALAGAGQWNVMLATVAAASVAAFWPMKNEESGKKGERA